MSKREKMILTTFKLPEALVKKIDLLVARGKYLDRSEAIRAALEQYFNGTARRWLEAARSRKLKRQSEGGEAA